MITEKIEPANKIAVSPSEAAALLSLDRNTFYRKIMPLVREGTIRSVRVGARQRIFVESLRAWAESQAVGHPDGHPQNRRGRQLRAHQ